MTTIVARALSLEAPTLPLKKQMNFQRAIMSPMVNWAIFNQWPSNLEIAIWWVLELLQTYDGKFCLKSFSLTAVSQRRV